MDAAIMKPVTLSLVKLAAKMRGVQGRYLVSAGICCITNTQNNKIQGEKVGIWTEIAVIAFNEMAKLNKYLIHI